MHAEHSRIIYIVHFLIGPHNENPGWDLQVKQYKVIFLYQTQKWRNNPPNKAVCVNVESLQALKRNMKKFKAFCMKQIEYGKR